MSKSKIIFPQIALMDADYFCPDCPGDSKPGAGIQGWANQS
jgi:hypothetical protein